MQDWQIKILEREVAALKSLDGIITDYGPYIFVGVVFLLMAFGIWTLSGGLRRKLLKGKPVPYTRPVIFIWLPGSQPPLLETFNPFPPSHHSAQADHPDDCWE